MSEVRSWELDCQRAGRKTDPESFRDGRPESEGSKGDVYRKDKLC